MKTRIRPLAYVGNKSMLNRIHMNIINMAFEVIFITYQMFPKMPLPEASFSSSLSNNAQILGFRQRPRKTAFNQAPSFAEIGIAQTAWICSGNTTHASIRNGWCCLTALTVFRNKSTSRTSKSLFLRSSKFTVKNHVPPGTNARLKLGMVYYNFGKMNSVLSEYMRPITLR